MTIITMKKMSILECIWFFCVVVIVGSELGEAQHCEKVVDKSGHGHFSTIQSAIDSIPSGNVKWVCILIKAGTYREKVIIPYDKPYIYLKGQNRRTTQVIWDDHDSVAQSPTFSSLADNIVVSSISFVNSYNDAHATSTNPRAPAVAAMISGDKTSFYKCRFSGVQDTLWDNHGRHYFYQCSIEGAVDFIFGGGQSIYEKCLIHFIGGGIGAGLAGFITAQGRTDPNDPSGFVFKKCVVNGKGSTFLGRPWRGYARVLFYNSRLTKVVQPLGWNSWNIAGHERQLTFAEHLNYGPGSNTTSRVSWEKKLSAGEVHRLTSITFIDNEGWIGKQPKET